MKILQKVLDFLVGDRDDGHSVESCSGGLLGKEIFGERIFTYKIPILGFSVCEFAGFLQILVDAIDQLVNDCTECEDPDAPTSTFSVLETKLNSLLQDTVGGTPSVEFTPTSDDIRSTLDIDLTLQWSFLEASQLKIDLATILEGMEIDEDMKNFIKGIIAFEGQAGIEIAGSLKFSLGVGFEYLKKTETAIPYVKGSTGITLDFSVDANAVFQASIGPLSAMIDCEAIIDNYGEPLSVFVGLNPRVNYYISTDSSLRRNGFQRVSSFLDLGDEIEVAVKGQVHAELYAVYLGGLGDAFLRIQISDINNVIQGKPGAVAFYWKATFFEVPSILDILLTDPVAIVDAIDRLIQPLSDMTLGRNGAVTNFAVPFVGSAVRAIIAFFTALMNCVMISHISALCLNHYHRLLNR